MLLGEDNVEGTGGGWWGSDMNSMVTVIIEDGCGDVFVCRDMHSFLIHKMFPGICNWRPKYTRVPTRSVACITLVQIRRKTQRCFARTHVLEAFNGWLVDPTQ